MVIGWLKRLAQPKDEAPQSAHQAPQPDPVAEPTVVDIPREKVAQRAYEIWVARGKPAGTSHQDWLEAEAQLRAETQSAGPMPRRSR
jgi:hypothetical protein